MLHIVEIGGMKFSDEPSDIIITHALASCVGVTVYCKSQKSAGMLHIALPKALADTTVSRNGYFADKGLPIFLKKFISDYNCSWNDIEIKIYGGAKSIKDNDVFDIGSKNLISVKEILDSYSLNYKIMATGGRVSRTIELKVDNGYIKISELPIII